MASKIYWLSLGKQLKGSTTLNKVGDEITSVSLLAEMLPCDCSKPVRRERGHERI